MIAPIDYLSYHLKMKRIELFFQYYTPSVEIKDFNVLTDGNSFFDTPTKNKEETHGKIVEMSKNDNDSKHYKLTAIDLRIQIELENPNLKQQINFIGRLDKDNATMFFIIKISKETTFKFSQNAVIVV